MKLHLGAAQDTRSHNEEEIQPHQETPRKKQKKTGTITGRRMESCTRHSRDEPRSHTACTVPPFFVSSWLSALPAGGKLGVGGAAREASVRSWRGARGKFAAPQGVRIPTPRPRSVADKHKKIPRGWHRCRSRSSLLPTDTDGFFTWDTGPCEQHAGACAQPANTPQHLSTVCGHTKSDGESLLGFCFPPSPLHGLEPT